MLVVRFTAILTYLSVPLFHIIVVSHIRVYGNDFSEVANSKTEIHLTNTPSEVRWSCDVATIELEGDSTLLGLFMLLRLVDVVRRSCKRPEARNTLRNRLVVGSTAMFTYQSVLLFQIVIF